jgi:hypothetical protein
MLSELHSLNLKLCSKQYNKKFILHLILAPQLSSGWRHNYSTKTRQAGWANEQSMYSIMSMGIFFKHQHYVIWPNVNWSNVICPIMSIHPIKYVIVSREMGTY